MLMTQIQTERLRLIPLLLDQLQCYIASPEVLEQELGFEVSRAIVTDQLRRAIAMKIARMERASPSVHAWYTYWLIVVRDSLFGAGLAGFKGLPDTQGQVEIGYGLDPAYQNKGYMTEAVQGLIQWAFQDPGCRAVIAPNTKKWNVASSHVLKKVGMQVYGKTEEALDWRIDREMDHELDFRIPGPSSAWQLWYSDTFDWDSAPALQTSGTNIVDGLYKLWLHTLKEGILENGNASFSRFHLTWGNTGSTRVDVFVEPFRNPSLMKLRQWAHIAPDNNNSEEELGKALLLRLAHLHYELLQKSSRWSASAIDYSAESKELLARVDVIKEPEELA